MDIKMRDELQSYLDQSYKNSKIGAPNTIFGEVHIRFELGGDELFRIIRNGVEIEWWKDGRRMNKTDKINYQNHILNRVGQATSRATTLFHETFNNPEVEIWVLIYEWEGGIFNHKNDFLLKQFSPECILKFYDKQEQLETQFIIDEDGSFTSELAEARVLIGKVKVNDIPAEKIFTGIANNEMGLEPAICQDVYFLDPNTDNGFYMYDDRGCYVWSNKSEKIRYLYDKRNDWIVNYHRPEIDKYFVESDV